MSSKLSQYKREIPELQQIKKCLKDQCYETKRHINNIKAEMLGSNGLAARESIIEDINSLKEKVAKLQEELDRLSNSY